MIGRIAKAPGCNRDPPKRSPACGGAHWSLACLFVEEWFSLFLFLSIAVFVEPLVNKKSNRCASGFPQTFRAGNAMAEPRAVQSLSLGNMSRRCWAPSCQNLRRIGCSRLRHKSGRLDTKAFEINGLTSCQ